MEYVDNNLTYQTYSSLRSSVGWNNFSEEQVTKALDNSIYTITVMENNEAVAMGRLLGDGVYYLVIIFYLQILWLKYFKTLHTIYSAREPKAR